MGHGRIPRRIPQNQRGYMSESTSKFQEIPEMAGRTFKRVFKTHDSIPLHKLRCHWYDGTRSGNNFDPETEKFDYCTMEDCGYIPEDSVVFTDGVFTVAFGHMQSCCERVELESTDIPLDQLEGHRIIRADVRSITRNDDDGERTDTWYTFEVEDVGTCTMRWCGTSNGYYSTEVEMFVEDRTFYEKWWKSVT